jgi:outer membrane lipoprotein-sorting protein
MALAQGDPQKTDRPKPGESPTPGPAASPALVASAATAPAPPTPEEALLDTAIEKLRAIPSVKAKIVEKVEMLDQKFEVRGRFLKAPKDRIRLELQVFGLADSEGKMEQVCDGTTWWDYQQVFETKIYHKLDIGPILTKLRTADLGPGTRDYFLNNMGFAGPEALLAGLRDKVGFNIQSAETLDGRAVWKITGIWKNRDGLFGPDSRPLPPFANLPSYIPSLVKVWLGKDDYWPYKVELVGQETSVLYQSAKNSQLKGQLEDTRRTGPDGRKIGSRADIQKPLQTRITLIYQDVQINTSIADAEFDYKPPAGAKIEDDTKLTLTALENLATQRAAQKKTEAAKGEDALLKEGIDVPDVPKPADIKPGAGTDSPPLVPPSVPPS